MIFSLSRSLGNKSGIYLIRNNVNYHRYVGSAASSFIGRLQNHVNELQKGLHWNYRLQHDWSKYGDGLCEFIVLEECPPEHCEQREQWWIDNLHPEYNLCLVAGSRLGYKLSQETKDKISKSNTGKVFSELHRMHISEAKRGCRNPHHGYMWTDAQRLAASISRKGRKAWNTGMTMDDEFRDRCRTRMMGNKHRHLHHQRMLVTT